MTQGLFLTGTDTGVGKTLVATAILRALVASGVRAVGMKPVAAGIAPGAAVNADVEALVAAGNVDASLSDVNPYSFAPAIAPHLAAARAGVAIDLDRIAAAYERLRALRRRRRSSKARAACWSPFGCTDRHARRCRAAGPAGRAGGRDPAGLPQSRAALRAGYRGARPRARRLDRQPDRSGDGRWSTPTFRALPQRLPAPLVVDIAWRADGAPPLRLDRASLRALDLRRDV